MTRAWPRPAPGWKTPQLRQTLRRLQAALGELESAQEENDTLYARWAELTEKAV